MYRHVSVCAHRPRSVGPPGAGVTSWVVKGLGSKPHWLQEQRVLLTAEPLSSPKSVGF